MSQIWLITGCSRGLGRAFTEAALAAGHSVVAGARNPDQLADLRSKFGEKIHPVSLDVTNEARAKAAVDAAVAHFGGLDVLETAELLDVSEATVNREWRAAKAWLKHKLRSTQ